MTDLISRQELREWVANWFEKNRYYHPYSKSNNIPITELYDILEQLPTIDPAENGGCWGCDCKKMKHGKWLDHVRDYWCSECGGRIQKEQVKGFPICPYCGARMDKQDKEK